MEIAGGGGGDGDGGKRITQVLLLAAVAGSALLAWWTVKFHPSNEQLWMVAVALVLLGTAAVVSFSLLAAGCSEDSRGHASLSSSSSSSSSPSSSWVIEL
ncbi:hypothetical protein AXF42_Ash018978 [Apostasia shenzhenica]|uniref:Uncharacterized protein n=1 Tax=Apostasia shenzhenica TaxID=1088818 RepID=A0A2I0AC04_9ASPA|nr:hypothetical protein AXF42_Ash018978 [Apostasia shenzhenica]